MQSICTSIQKRNESQTLQRHFTCVYDYIIPERHSLPQFNQEIQFSATRFYLKRGEIGSNSLLFFFVFRLPSIIDCQSLGGKKRDGFFVGHVLEHQDYIRVYIQEVVQDFTKYKNKIEISKGYRSNQAFANRLEPTLRMCNICCTWLAADVNCHNYNRPGQARPKWNKTPATWPQRTHSCSCDLPN